MLLQDYALDKRDKRQPQTAYEADVGDVNINDEYEDDVENENKYYDNKNMDDPDENEVNAYDMYERSGMSVNRKYVSDKKVGGKVSGNMEQYSGGDETGSTEFYDESTEKSVNGDYYYDEESEEYDYIEDYYEDIGMSDEYEDDNKESDYDDIKYVIREEKHGTTDDNEDNVIVREEYDGSGTNVVYNDKSYQSEHNIQKNYHASDEYYNEVNEANSIEFYYEDDLDDLDGKYDDLSQEESYDHKNKDFQDDINYQEWDDDVESELENYIDDSDLYEEQNNEEGDDELSNLHIANRGARSA